MNTELQPITLSGDPEVGYCARCGLRRPLGRVNSELGPGQELVRCIDCFFGPGDPDYVFFGTAILKSTGETGDVVGTNHWGTPDLFFEPHGAYQNRFIVTENQLHAFTRFTPERYSVRSPEEEF